MTAVAAGGGVAGGGAVAAIVARMRESPDNRSVQKNGCDELERSVPGRHNILGARPPHRLVEAPEGSIEAVVAAMLTHPSCEDDGCRFLANMYHHRANQTTAVAAGAIKPVLAAMTLSNDEIIEEISCHA